MTQFEKIKNMTFEEMAEAVQLLNGMNLCFDSTKINCGEGSCIFRDLCKMNPNDDAKKWLESEV